MGDEINPPPQPCIEVEGEEENMQIGRDEINFGSGSPLLTDPLLYCPAPLLLSQNDTTIIIFIYPQHALWLILLTYYYYIMMTRVVVVPLRCCTSKIFLLDLEKGDEGCASLTDFPVEITPSAIVFQYSHKNIFKGDKKKTETNADEG